jgi:hypothetical protein
MTWHPEVGKEAMATGDHRATVRGLYGECVWVQWHAGGFATLHVHDLTPPRKTDEELKAEAWKQYGEDISAPHYAQHASAVFAAFDYLIAEVRKEARCD